MMGSLDKIQPMKRFSCILIGRIFYEMFEMKKISNLERDKNKGDISHPISVYNSFDKDIKYIVI